MTILLLLVSLSALISTLLTDLFPSILRRAALVTMGGVVASVVFPFITFYEVAVCGNNCAPTLNDWFCCEWNIKWTGPDYTLFITVLYTSFYLLWLKWMKKGNHEIQSWLSQLHLLLIPAGLLVTVVQFFFNCTYQKQVLIDLQRFLNLSIQEKVTLGVVIFSLLLVFFLFQKWRNWLISSHGATCYFLLIITLRAALFYWRVSLYMFLLVSVGIILFAIIGTVIFSKKKDLNWKEWGKKFIETLFYLQIIVVVGFLLEMVFSQSMPCFWLYQTMTFFLFEAAVCVSKLLIQIRALEIKVTPIGIPRLPRLPRPGGLLWSNYREGVSNIIKLVIAKHTPALLGIEEGSYEAEKKALSPSTSAMMQPGAQGGGYPVPMGGQPVLHPSGVNVPLHPSGVNVPLHPSGVNVPLHPSGVNVPYAPSSASSLYDLSEQKILNRTTKTQTPLLNCLRKVGWKASAQLGSVVVITDGRGIERGTFVDPVITTRGSLPVPPNGHCEVIINGAIFHWTPYSFNQLEKHVVECNQLDINKENPIPFRQEVPYLPNIIWYGGYRYISSDQVIPNVPSLIVNGKYFILESPQPAKTVAEYIRGVDVAVTYNNPIIGKRWGRPLYKFEPRSSDDYSTICNYFNHFSKAMRWVIGVETAVQTELEHQRQLPQAQPQLRPVGARGQAAAESEVAHQRQLPHAQPHQPPVGAGGQAAGQVELPQGQPHQPPVGAVGQAAGQVEVPQAQPQQPPVGAGGQASAQVELPQKEPGELPVLVVGAGSPVVGAGPEADQGAAGVGEQPQSEQPTRPINRPASLTLSESQSQQRTALAVARERVRILGHRNLELRWEPSGGGISTQLPLPWTDEASGSGRSTQLPWTDQASGSGRSTQLGRPRGR